MGKKRASEAESVDGLSFEQAMERLEQIVERIESGQAGLEQALTEYEQGVALVRRCREVLNNAQQLVEELGKLAGAEGNKKAATDAGSDEPEGEGEGKKDGLPF